MDIEILEQDGKKKTRDEQMYNDKQKEAWKNEHQDKKNTANEEEAESDATVVLVTEDIEDEEFEKKIEGVMKYEKKKKRKLHWEGGQGAEEGYEEGDAAQVSQDKGRKGHTTEECKRILFQPWET